MNQDYEAQISRVILLRSKTGLNMGINNECRKCLRILKGCEGRASATPCLGFLDVKYGEEQI